MNKLSVQSEGRTNIGFRSRRFLLYLIDIATVFFVSAFVYLLFAKSGMPSFFNWMAHTALFTFCCITVRTLFGVYGLVWRYASASNFLILCLSDLVGGLFFLPVDWVISKPLGMILSPSYTDMLLLGLISLLATIFLRQSYQVYHAHHQSRDTVYWLRRFLGKKAVEKNVSVREKKRIAIIGAGRRGTLLVDSLLNDYNAEYDPYCFFDNDTQKAGSTLRGLKIYPVDASTIRRIRELSIQEIVIAIQNLSSEQKMEMFDFYEKSGLKVRIYDASPIEGQEDHKRIRDIQIEDLLFRDAISVAGSGMSSAYGGKVIMITGGGGSIGSELCRQVAKLSPKRLIIVDIYENNVYEIQQELIRTYGNRLELVCEIASVRDAEKIESLFEQYRPEVVFHAAAHKHVPLMENCCDEAVKNNVFGTFNVANAAEKYGTAKFIMISTDKAVNPTNIMGATKRLCEMIIQSKKDSATDFVAVRFGNVLGSNGSVIPLFMRQIENGGPVTLTDKRIVRYFMTIPEAAQLVMQAGVSAAKGEIYVLDMGKPMKILSLAENMIRLAGLKPYEDIDIQEIGLRPGEKLYEELLMKTEELDKTDNEKIFIERDAKISRNELAEKFSVVEEALKTRDGDTIRSAMMQVVPTYHDADSVNRKAVYAEEMKCVYKSQKPAVNTAE